jgi:crotonobetainyl-CoA:carnitine CoA-transferase CaiB-like acyl-CoA transferase
LCRALGVEGYDAPEVATSAARRTHIEVANSMIDMCHARAANYTVAEARKAFDAERLSYAFVNSNEQLVEDSHAIAVGMFQEFDHDVAGRVRVPRHPARFGATAARLSADAPSLGQHTDEVLAELGLADRIDELRRQAIVA